jgi:NAD(P)-dependent dehydrogenase (short-subunit alcohol dehydrogenase family)
MTMDLGLAGRVALVTGASEGLGRATAERLAAEGATVVICARGAERLRAAAEGIHQRGGTVLDLPADVSRPEECERLVAAARARFGRLDILVNNAGTRAAQPFEALDDAAWQSDLDLKLFAAIRLTRLALPAMREAGAGRIVNILNTGAKQPGPGGLPTAASRAAGMAMTKTLSKELASDRILVNAICVGLVKSAQWERHWEQAGRPGTLDEFYAAMARERGVPLGRVAEASELAALVAFLVSAQAAYITGVAINFDGGMTAVV